MAVMMTKFTQNFRRGRSRQVGKGAVSCEVLESRRVLSAGVQLATAVPLMQNGTNGGWESRWVEMAQTLEGTGTQFQILSNLGIAGLGTVVRPGQSGSQIQVNDGDASDSAAISTLASPQAISPLTSPPLTSPSTTSTLASPSTTSTLASPSTTSTLASPSTSTVPTAGVLIPVGQPMQIGGGASGGASAGATAGSSSLNTLPEGITVSQIGTATQAASGDSATGSATSSAVTSAPTTAMPPMQAVSSDIVTASATSSAVTSTPTTAPYAAGEFVLAGAPTPIVGGWSAGATAGGTVASPSISTLPASINVGPGGGPSLVTSGAANSPMVTTTSVAALPLPVGIVPDGTPIQGLRMVPGGGPIQVVNGGSAGSSAGSLVASSTEGSPAQIVDVGAVNAPMQVVSGTTQAPPTELNANAG
jgi:hypothetical protein